MRLTVIQSIALAGCLSAALAQEVQREMPPLPPSPVAQFREWLTMPETQRDHILAKWPEEKQAVLKRKLAHYSKMQEEERERRLTMLELRHYLRPLMSVAPEERTDTLKMVPPRLQGLVMERLARWDKLNPTLQEQVLEHDSVLNYFSRVPPQPPHPGEAAPAAQPATQRGLTAWTQLTEEERRNLSGHVSEFFELPLERRSKTLETLSPADRQEIEKTLAAFADLPPEQKRACIESFHKFANMAPGERNQFLRNAARWQAMTREDRQTWKRLVESLPPMPPVAGNAPPLPVAQSNSSRRQP